MNVASRAPIVVLLAGLLLGACGGPDKGPAQSIVPGDSTPAGTGEPQAAPGVPGLASALHDTIDPAAIVADLERLASITAEHGGSRPAGSAGQAAVTEWVAGELRAAGYEVTLDSLTVPLFSQDGPGVLEIVRPAAPTFEDPRDFKAMHFSPSGDVTAGVVALDFDPDAQPGDRNGTGCDEASWAEVPRGVIVLVQPGPCWMRTMVEQAQATGAVGLISANPDWSAGNVLRPTLIDPGGLHIPVIGVTREVGQALADAAAAGDKVHVQLSTTVRMEPSDNVIGETPGGDADHVVMLGAHSDSVIDGPGINDNGSGTAVVLEIARRLAAQTGGDPARKVRVAFWTAEEIGLWGSVDYAGSLDEAGRRSIAAYLNFDMLGSANGVRQVYAGTSLGNVFSETLTGLFAQAFEADGLAWETIDLVGSGDDYQFNELGIAVGGLFSGANGIKTQAQVDTFGGAADTPFDACYHLPCDTFDRLDPALLEQMARAAGWVTGALAGGEVELRP